MKTAIVLLVLFLSGCGAVQKLVCTDVAPPTKEVHIDPRYFERCKPLQTIPKENPTFEKILLNTTDNAIIYAECRSKQDDSIKLLKEFSNVK